ncbi:hypothetical protein PCL_08532 [Purpureocillium lilacinum]|uniref:Uncharacterized protein n=1 Tax=Purpureocillium lilacinum TaxID=33203 RepID=A0A2U3DRE2_PURLI|nr:hypothetical protein PCL_08532 [Purpureocillium lilacinum]
MPTMPARPLLGPAPARAAEPICGAKSGDGKMGSRPISPSGMASRPVRAPPMGCGCRGQNGVGFRRTGFGRRSPSRNQSDMWCLVFDCFGREREAEREKDGWMEGDGSVASACCTFFFAALALLTRPPSRAPQVLFNKATCELRNPLLNPPTPSLSARAAHSSGHARSGQGIVEIGSTWAAVRLGAPHRVPHIPVSGLCPKVGGVRRGRRPPASGGRPPTTLARYAAALPTATLPSFPGRALSVALSGGCGLGHYLGTARGGRAVPSALPPPETLAGSHFPFKTWRYPDLAPRLAAFSSPPPPAARLPSQTPPVPRPFRYRPSSEAVAV